jgi:hypothetical protein
MFKCITGEHIKSLLKKIIKVIYDEFFGRKEDG